MVRYQANLDAAFAALADPTRRGILERLGRGDASISELAGDFARTLTGIKTHVSVLEDARLVTNEKQGRVRTCRLGPRRLAEEAAWIDTYRRHARGAPRSPRCISRANPARHRASVEEGAAMIASANATVTTPTDRTIRIERIFAAPRERVWAAMTDPALVAQWWGRGNKLTIERLEPRRGGHWRFVEHTPDGARHGFEGRFREITPPQRIVQTFEWDGMPGHVVINETELEDLGDGRTRLIMVSLFSTTEERDGMRQSGMEGGMNQSYRALDQVLDGTAPVPRPGVRGMVKKVAFTMYPVQDAARARAFYEETLGLSVGVAGSQGDMHWIEYDLPGGGCFALTNTNGAQPSAAAGGTIALEVDDLPALVDRLKSLGVAFKAEGIRGPHCQMAVCLDSEGNSLLLHQLDAP